MMLGWGAIPPQACASPSKSEQCFGVVEPSKVAQDCFFLCTFTMTVKFSHVHLQPTVACLMLRAILKPEMAKRLLHNKCAQAHINAASVWGMWGPDPPSLDQLQLVARDFIVGIARG